ncbi:glycoside hydrolase family 13 protein [Butyrivibrio sp. YAB3001]|uniref:glycoside hydrolase family 13 protein n=1 Tax=Butyrivibrio sp. YAB3001 TaxID=1520812 RepID=UPI0008F61F5B|nr:glycoside hydrolase family 13 protein [Butyrivibrio sp. YAB3001]SFC88892.1 alpha-glucosidase [Butyrivibrio sp. YAB3001]
MNIKALFHDMTLDYLRPAEPDKNRITQLRFRGHKDDKIEVTLVWGNEKFIMTLSETNGEFNYYDTEVKTGNDPVSYYFEIRTENDNFYIYDKRGCQKDILDSMKFRVFPGFSTPNWAKGAVMYQIFVDRFCNGDKNNDVLTGEYTYNGHESIRVEDWSQYPDPDWDFGEFYGGDLQGVLDKLDYLADLGIDVIYFNPIFVSPSSHKYDTQDYDHIDPHFGVIIEDKGDLHKQSDGDDNRNSTRYISRVTNKKNLEASDALFAKVVEEAHKRGIKVILDGVFNHCGSFNKWLDKERIYESQPGYEKGAYVSENSPYRNFFSFRGGDWPYNNDYDGWWGYSTLPKLNYEGSHVLENYILGIGKKWVSPPYNADGWRLDVGADLGHSPEYNHHFWKRFRDEVKKANPSALILAEHYGPAGAWLQGEEWDTVMNYDAFMEPVTWFLTGMDKHSDKFMPSRMGNSREFFDAMMYNGGENFSMPSLYTAMNELSNHDHSRFLTRTSQKVGRSRDLMPQSAETGVRKAVMREGVIIQFTWPGAPTIYYGDEAGVCGFTDPDNRRTYPWGHEDKEMIAFHKEMISIHKRYPELISGSIRELLADDNYIAYGRFNRTAAIVVAINNNDYEVTKDIEVWQLGIPKDARLSTIIMSDNMGYIPGGAGVTSKNGVITITLSRKSGTILRYNSFEAISKDEFWADNILDFS